MNGLRILGDNVKLLLQERSKTKSEFAEELGYSIADVNKLCDGRLAVTNEDIKAIADLLGVTRDALLIRKSEECYAGPEFLQCQQPFKHEENRTKVLDIFDMHCDLQEVSQHEN